MKTYSVHDPEFKPYGTVITALESHNNTPRGRNTFLLYGGATYDSIRSYTDEKDMIASDGLVFACASQEDIIDGELSKDRGLLFYIPSGTIVEIYGVDLSYTKSNTYRILVTLDHEVSQRSRNM